MLHVPAKQEYLNLCNKPNLSNKPNISTRIKYIFSHIINFLICILVQLNWFCLLGIKELNVFHIRALQERLVNQQMPMWKAWFFPFLYMCFCWLLHKFNYSFYVRIWNIINLKNSLSLGEKTYWFSAKKE